MRYWLWLLLSAGLLRAGAQSRYDGELQLTETRFALESQIHGLKWGFLQNMDTAALGLNNQGFVKLYPVWKDRPDQSSFLLQWKPTALWWSEDGLFGLTTGPYFTKTAKDSMPLATGYFFTIWQRPHTSAPFKFVVDAGVSMTPGVVSSTFVNTPVVREMIPSGDEHSASNSRSTPFPAQVDAFRKEAAGQSLGRALKSYTHERSFVLVSDYGKLNRDDLGDAKPLGGKLHHQQINFKWLSANCYYEWGTFRSADGAGTYSGFYVQVWQTGGQKPLLLAAVYKFDQSLKS